MKGWLGGREGVLFDGAWLTPCVLIGSMLLGAVLGIVSPDVSEHLDTYADMTLLMLVSLLFFGVRFEQLRNLRHHGRFVLLVVLTNFVLVPVIGWAVASSIVGVNLLFMVGLVIYFMSPCTDWFLGFTRLSGGNVALGATLIPLNMLCQLVLYPVYLNIFAYHPAIATVQMLAERGDASAASKPFRAYLTSIQPMLIGDTLFHWFFVPCLTAVLLHQLLKYCLQERTFERILVWADRATLWVIALLVLQIFAAHIETILMHAPVFKRLLLAVFVFFVMTALLGEGISRVARLKHPEHALLTMSIAARNAPLMLAVTMHALPGQPLIYASLIIGMLLEFPHLTVLQRLLIGSPKNILQRSA